jgi:hypothetical protein
VDQVLGIDDVSRFGYQLTGRMKSFGLVMEALRDSELRWQLGARLILQSRDDFDRSCLHIIGEYDRKSCKVNIVSS